MVPVVLSSNVSTYSAHAPPHSYISAADFPGPAALAAHLLHLNRTPAAYLSYFWWREHYDVVIGTPYEGMCALCRRLHLRERGRSVVEDLEGFWDKGRCEGRGKHVWSKVKEY